MKFVVIFFFSFPSSSYSSSTSENSNSRKPPTSENLEDGCDKKIDIDDNEANINLISKNAENIENPISRAIEEHDIDLLKFSEELGKAIVTDALRIEIIKLGSKYFQNIEGPFLPTNNRSMNKTWFKKILENGLGQQVTRSWLVYSPSKKSDFCICCLIFSRFDNQSSLEQES